ncbi:NYN domain-containing protein [Halorhodospira sp. 9622]|uniref:NYN domain-containing protein n=1 Tax=Halorhodospira sp. 9622 TaxID=2899136 RepID=UPI001EE8AFBC|nr:NYN domain-containing protein [Halorhodospira sp. 9622]MCG5537369.1 NYN domain-containing protein [Halorhodospira sp. 9622]
MAFYDGNYFKQGQLYFRYKEERGWFSLPELPGLFEKFVAQHHKTSLEMTKLVGAHYYDGRPSVKASATDTLEKERGFEMALIRAGIVPHYLPLREVEKGSSTEDDPQFKLAQKGVDVELALDVLDYAHDDRFDVAILITGDQDFLPVVRKITSLGKDAIVAHFEIQPWTDSRGHSHSGTYCSRGLIDAAYGTINFNTIVKDANWNTEVKSLFFQPG